MVGAPHTREWSADALHERLGGLLRIAFAASGALLLIDLALMGQGLAIPGTGQPLRRVLFVVLLGSALTLKLHVQRVLGPGDLIVPLGLAVLAAVWAAVIPASFGFPLGFSLRDFLPWTALLLLALWPQRAGTWPVDWQRVRRFVRRIGLVLAALHLVIWALLVADIVPVVAVWAAMASIVGAETDGDTFFMIGPVPEGGMRVYWSSSIFLLIVLYVLLTERNYRLKWAAVALVGAALWITHLRALLAAVAIWATVSIGLRLFVRRPPEGAATLLAVSAWALAIISVAIAIRPEVLEYLGLARDVSDAWRVDQSAALLGQFGTSPWVGLGFGSFAPTLQSSEAAPFSYELTFHALLMKLGVLGMAVLLLVVYFAVELAGAAGAARNAPRAYWNWLGFTTGLWFCGATNPVVTNFVGMAVLLLALLDLRYQARAHAPGAAR